MLDQIMNILLPLGMRASAVSAAHIPELAAEYETQHICGDMSDTSYSISKGLTDNEEINAIAAGQSIIVVAAPSPLNKLIFHYGGKPHTVLIPPTYMDYEQKPPIIEKALNAALEGAAFRAVYRWRLPAKLLAVRSGLAEYGRNNIAYVEGMGSFVYLSTFVADAPCEDGWRASRRMALCDSCELCVKHCPTGAIQKDKRIIDVDRCVTWHNERNSETPFPGWMDVGAHNSLVGCMRCQAACPANREHMSRVGVEVVFKDDEAALLLDGKPFDALPEELGLKLKKVCVNEFYHVVARNLRALIG